LRYTYVSKRIHMHMIAIRHLPPPL
jgi:hypothetical protein